ncbi:phage portal protein [Virgibacillus dokdonensis]|uniref:Phage portal protein n=1 Tax=Virgibacillus dokdonensis TaxID=302167 RepID=A0A3E0WVM9_9BACI|nr:phage portal protein [Virgibacillus dokdonensis]RFA36221.1 phage portal protein [Virgibacillus dokdonensis]
MNGFETDTNKTTTTTRFPDNANKHLTYKSLEKLLENLSDLRDLIATHEGSQVPRLKTLENYYLGKNEKVLKRTRKEEHLSNHKAAHAFARDTSQFIQGYMVGVPIKVEAPEESAGELITEINRDNDADAHNSELTLDLSIYGRAYELLFRSKQDITRFVLVDPKHTFVIYDETVEQNPIAGVYYFRDDNGKLKVNLHTEKNVMEIEEVNGKLEITNQKPHGFEGITIIEYANNRFRQGDFEPVLTLIDLYDSAQSDTANYMTDLNDAMLVIEGDVEFELEDIKNMREANAIMLQPGGGIDGKQSTARAYYIYKQYDVSGVEKYKDRIQNDIHKYTNTPNLNDESFAGVQSGEAMKYKLFGLEQVRATKERFFKRSMRQRYRLISNISKTLRDGDFDANDLTITFTPNLPKSIKDEVDIFNALGGQLSDETMLSLLSFVDSPQEELERIEKESPQQSASTYGNFGAEQFSNAEQSQEVIENE